MSWIKLSLIIPMYNVESYISECINSIKNQITDEVEVIIIDDGSTDNSKKILDELIFNLPKNKAKQFKVFSQKNQGQSAARNKALNIACGEYVGFIDSDDILDGNYIKELFRIINGYEPDIISIRAARFKKLINDQDVISEMKLLDKVGLYDLTDELKIEIFNRHYWFIWSYIVKRSIIKNNRFISGIYFEDAVFLSSLVLRLDNIYFSDKKIYNYRYNVNGSLLSASSKNVQKNINSYKFIINYFYNEIRNNNFYSISYVISLQTYLAYLKDKKGIFAMIKAYYEFLDYHKYVNKKLLLNRGNFLFYKFGVFFLIFLSIFRK